MMNQIQTKLGPVRHTQIAELRGALAILHLKDRMHEMRPLHALEMLEDIHFWGWTLLFQGTDFIIIGLRPAFNV